MKIKREDDAEQDQKPRIGIVADISSSARRALELEKQRYPGASAWAPDEEHLFKTLFQRAERPLLPAHWDVDLRGIPVQDSIFAAEGADADADADAGGAVVYSRSGKDYQGISFSPLPAHTLLTSHTFLNRLPFPKPKRKIE